MKIQTIKNKISNIFGRFPSWDEAAPDFDPIIIPLIRRVMPSIIAQDIIGVSPMTGPVSDIFTMRIAHSKNKKTDT